MTYRTMQTHDKMWVILCDQQLMHDAFKMVHRHYRINTVSCIIVPWAGNGYNNNSNSC